ncbi:MAG: VOC family protein [Pseudobdellovibrio sp.]
MISELKKIECCTLFVENLASTKAFYEDVFGLKVIFEDAVSVVLKLDNLMINLLQISEAAQLIEPAQVAAPSNGSRLVFTILVQNVDSVCEKLQKHNVKLLNGPINRLWGRRTAAFTDPAGNAWEVAQEF